jgi:hypothetical protein
MGRRCSWSVTARDASDGRVVAGDAEIRSGRLPITKEPTAGYRKYGPVAGYDPAQNAVSDRIDAWQSIHMPHRTAASMGLSTTEDGIHPYVMASGTYWAHVMIMQRPLRY